VIAPGARCPDHLPVQKYRNVDHVGVVNNVFTSIQKDKLKSAKSSEMII
jgi:hypothetical protein